MLEFEVDDSYFGGYYRVPITDADITKITSQDIGDLIRCSEICDDDCNEFIPLEDFIETVLTKDQRSTVKKFMRDEIDKIYDIFKL